MNRLDQVMEANALEKALILVAQLLEEGGHGLVLVRRAIKVVREAATGHSRSPLRIKLRRPADGSDIGTYESMAMWNMVSVLNLHLRTTPNRRKTAHIQVAGKKGLNLTQFPLPTPPSPVAKRRLTPRAPSCMNRSHKYTEYSFEPKLSSWPYDVVIVCGGFGSSMTNLTQAV